MSFNILDVVAFVFGLKQPTGNDSLLFPLAAGVNLTGTRKWKTNTL